MTADLTISFVPLASLLKRYVPRFEQLVTVGVGDGTYGRVDGRGCTYMTDAELRAGKLVHSTSFECGAFYPETVVVVGSDDRGRTLPHWMLRIVMRLMNTTHDMEDIILPRGVVGGTNTWMDAVRSLRGGEWWHQQKVADKLQELQGVEVMNARGAPYLALFADDLESFLLAASADVQATTDLLSAWKGDSIKP